MAIVCRTTHHFPYNRFMKVLLLSATFPPSASTPSCLAFCCLNFACLLESCLLLPRSLQSMCRWLAVTTECNATSSMPSRLPHPQHYFCYHFRTCRCPLIHCLCTVRLWLLSAVPRFSMLPLLPWPPSGEGSPKRWSAFCSIWLVTMHPVREETP